MANIDRAGSFQQPRVSDDRARHSVQDDCLRWESRPRATNSTSRSYLGLGIFDWMYALQTKFRGMGDNERRPPSSRVSALWEGFGPLVRSHGSLRIQRKRCAMPRPQMVFIILYLLPYPLVSRESLAPRSLAYWNFQRSTRIFLGIMKSLSPPHTQAPGFLDNYRLFSG